MTTQKFGRNYRLTINPADGGDLIVVKLPFTCRFWVNRNIFAALNSASIDLYNLSLANRRRIYQDRNNLGENIINGINYGRRTVALSIGYGDLLYEVFSGDILQASSAREGVDIVTRIEAFATVFDIASAQTARTLAPGPLADLFKSLVGDFPTLQLGAIGGWPQLLPRGAALNGNTWALIQQYSNGRCYIDNGKVYILQDNEVIETPSVPVIDASTGILETPRRESAFLTITTLLEPGIRINQLVAIKSQVEPGYNRDDYKVVGLEHTGTISSAVGGECRSTFQLNAPLFFQYNQVQGA